MVPLQLWKLLNSLMHMFLHVLDAWRLNWALITSWMVPLLFYSGHLACIFSNKNSTFQFVWRENCFSLCLSPFLIEFGFWSSSFWIMFTYKVFFSRKTFNPIFMDGTPNREHIQWFLAVFLIPVSYFNHRIIYDLNAVLSATFSAN